jgi:hypothetical protein
MEEGTVEREVASYSCYNIRVRCGSVVNERRMNGNTRATMILRDWPVLGVDGPLWREAQKQQAEVRSGARTG